MKLTTLFASVVGGAVTINLSALTCTATPKERPSNFDSLTIQIPQQAPVTTRRPLLPVDIETPRYNTENAYGQEGLTVASKIDDRLYSATYQQQPAILQCYDVSRTYRDEMNMQIVINDVADRFLERAILNGKNHIAKLKHVFNVPAGACMIYNSGGAWNLAEYTKTLNLQQKALFLPRIFNQVLDGLVYLQHIGISQYYLTPAHVIIDHPNHQGEPHATIINFSHSHLITFRNKQCSTVVTNSIGDDRYYAPESNEIWRTRPARHVKTCKNDAWNLGVTLFSVLPHPENFNEDDMNWQRWQTLRENTKTWLTSSPFALRNSQVIALLMPLYNAIDTLMKNNPDDRPDLVNVRHLSVSNSNVFA